MGGTLGGGFGTGAGFGGVGVTANFGTTGLNSGLGGVSAGFGQPNNSLSPFGVATPTYGVSATPSFGTTGFGATPSVGVGVSANPFGVPASSGPANPFLNQNPF